MKGEENSLKKIKLDQSRRPKKKKKNKNEITKREACSDTKMRTWKNF